MAALLDEPATANFARTVRTGTAAAVGAARTTAIDSSQPAVRTICVGLLGVGNVGQAVAKQLAGVRDLLRNRGIDAKLTVALVRDSLRKRSGIPASTQLVTTPAAFLAHEFDVVVEVLGGVEPAYSIVRKLLTVGTSVVTANKSLIAAHGEELIRIAAQSGATLRCEASALAGVPVLNNLRDRPLSARVEQLVGVVNGTSNYVLTRVARDGVTLDSAVQTAIRLGLAEPDPSFDLSGRDACEKLCVLLQHLGIGRVRREAIETVGIEQLTPDDLAQARVFGGVIKPIAAAGIGDDAVDAFVGPAFVPNAHPLANIDEQQNGIALCGPQIGKLCFSGPGAGPDVTAGTIIDDLIDAAAPRRVPGYSPLSPRAVRTATTAWLLRVEFAAGRARLEAAGSILSSHGVQPRGLFGLRQSTTADRLYTLTRPCDTQALRRAIDEIEATLDCKVLALRALSTDH